MEREEVLEFWFEAPAADAGALRRKMKRWFAGGAEVDREIRERFATLVERAVGGGCGEWADAPRGRLALVLVLDQLTRTVYRDDRRMVAGDARAQALAVEALEQGLDRTLEPVERNFLLMPLVHAEDLALQERAVAEMERLVADAPAWQRPVLSMGIEQSRKYRDVIARFGRFPHRNAVLGRASTPDEERFLRDWKQRQPPTGMTPSG
jgi:uncharacterized protein (DUF924 family)